MGTCSSREADGTPAGLKVGLRTGKKAPNRPVPHAAGLHGHLSYASSAGQSSRTHNSLTPSDLQHLKQRSMARKQHAVTQAEKLLQAYQGKSFHEVYDKPNLVSYGASCKVLTAIHKVTGAKVACKTIPKSSRNPGTQRMNVLNEISIMKEVEDHPNAVTLREVYETPHTYYLVMDCCDGGELFEHITKSKEVFTERHAAQILRSLMLFLAHMHSKGMAHMDIKPENIMFDSEGAQGVVKVIDFGSSIYIQPNETVRDAFGTVRYSSPEMAADENIGQKTDVWSAGIVMYFMLCGSAPFLKRDEVDTLNYIKNKPKVKFSGPRWASISQQAKDCISAMLEVEPEMRPNAQEVLQMAWLRTQGPDTSIQTDILLHLRTFANQSRMRRLLLGLMAANLSGSEANRLLNQFYSMDSDFSGTIELQELARVTQQALPDLDEAEVENLFHAMDLNHTGTVDVKEFFASLLHTMAPENQMAIARKSFVHLDRDQSGFVSKDAFVSAMVQQAVASGMPQEETSTLVKELEQEFCVLDANSDGKLSFEEFKSVLGLSEGRPGAVAVAAAAAAGKKPGHSPGTSGDGRAAAGAAAGPFSVGQAAATAAGLVGSRGASSGNLLLPGRGLSGRPSGVRTSGGREAVSTGGAGGTVGGGGAGGEGPFGPSSLVRLAMALHETTRSRTATGNGLAAVAGGGGGGALPEQRSVSGSEVERSHANGHNLLGHKRISSSINTTSVAAFGGASAGPSRGQSGTGAGTGAGMERASPSGPGSRTDSRTPSNRNNPAAAAAAVTAAVAATVAASLPSDAGDAARFRHDRSWPSDPASSLAASPHKTLSGRPAPRVVAYGPGPGDAPGLGGGGGGAAGGSGWSPSLPAHAHSMPSDGSMTWARDSGTGGFDAPSFASMLGTRNGAADGAHKDGAAASEASDSQSASSSIPAVYRQ